MTTLESVADRLNLDPDVVRWILVGDALGYVQITSEVTPQQVLAVLGFRAEFVTKRHRLTAEERETRKAERKIVRAVARLHRVPVADIAPPENFTDDVRCRDRATARMILAMTIGGKDDEHSDFFLNRKQAAKIVGMSVQEFKRWPFRPLVDLRRLRPDCPFPESQCVLYSKKLIDDQERERVRALRSKGP